jgi:hypothetical protein
MQHNLEQINHLNLLRRKIICPLHNLFETLLVQLLLLQIQIRILFLLPLDELLQGHHLAVSL